VRFLVLLLAQLGNLRIAGQRLKKIVDHDVAKPPGKAQVFLFGQLLATLSPTGPAGAGADAFNC
ncbi:MAG: hypothetical protein R3228_16885, partial [Halioglobus sp.]|nr:hypothetical protein [Halioglobus sp.]